MTDTQTADFLFLTHLGEHLSVLGVELVLVDKDGRDKGKPQMQTYSGFFIVLDNQWYFVTAGHALERTDGQLGKSSRLSTPGRSAQQVRFSQITSAPMQNLTPSAPTRFGCRPSSTCTTVHEPFFWSVPMYKPHEVWEIPPDDTVIWRYMDLTKLLGILHNKTLYFPNIQAFEDKFEGYTPLPTPEELHQHLHSGVKPPTRVHYPAAANYLHDQLKTLAKSWPRYLYVSCWHMNPGQSAAMWKLYLSAKEGVAVQSTFGRFRDSFNNTPQDIQFGMVLYRQIEKMDFEQRNIVHTGLLKRLSFAHEQELRAIYKDQERAERDRSNPEPEAAPRGFDIPVDVDMFIERVYLAPTCEPWIKPIVESLLEKYGLKGKPVIQSNLYDGPIS